MLGEVIAAEPDHIAPIADKMREADVLEVWLAAHSLPEKALTDSLETSVKAWTITGDGAPIGMFGVCSANILGQIGIPWLLGTDDMLKITRQFLRQSRDYVDQMNSLYPHLINFVHVDNIVSLRWLMWCGFVFDGPFPYGPDKADFFKFQRFANV